MECDLVTTMNKYAIRGLLHNWINFVWNVRVRVKVFIKKLNQQSVFSSGIIYSLNFWMRRFFIGIGTTKRNNIAMSVEKNLNLVIKPALGWRLLKTNKSLFFIKNCKNSRTSPNKSSLKLSNILHTSCTVFSLIPNHISDFFTQLLN